MSRAPMTSRAETLETFLERKRVQGSEKHTHTTMGVTPRDMGKYYIGDDELPEFYALYSDFVEIERKKIWLIEAPTTIGPMRVDLDFTYEDAIAKNQHTTDQLVKFCKKYVAALRTFVVVPAELEVYITEKRRPTPKKGGLRAGGVHIMIPSIRSTKHVEKSVRDIMLSQMEEVFGDLPLSIKEWDKVYDKGIANRSVGWTMYGSSKPEGLPYLVSYKLKMTEEDIIVDHTHIVPDQESLAMFKTRVLDSTLETPLTDRAKEIFGDLPENSESVRISGGRAVTPSRGRPAERKMGGSRDSSPNPGTILRPLTEEERAYYHEHVMNLSSTRADDYHEWVLVGQCLKNIHPDLYDEFEEFSRQNAKFDLRACMKQWNVFGFRNDGQKVQIGTLLYWSRLDNPEHYKEIQDNNIIRKIDTSLAGTEYDVASVVYAKFSDTYKCVSFGKNVWYKFMGHVWHELDRGVQLQQELSTEIWKAYKKRVDFYSRQLTDGSLDMCQSKEPCGCAFCECSQKESSLNKICTKLKSTKYKENVMKECKEIFLDESFVKKVDEDRYLLACRNGVFDMRTMEFRDGKQEDYLSFSTGLDIDTELNYKEYPAWNEVDRFLKEVLPNETVRSYFMSHLSMCLAGLGCQLFHILTGTGSNGKSMLMNLVETALGDYACKVPISLITQGRNKSSNASPEVVRLKGRRFVTMQEPDEAVPINTGIMKEITSSEKILCRDLYSGSKQMIEFELQCKFHLACNDKPKVNSNDGGTWRRLIVINFLSKFVQNPMPGQFRLDITIEQKVKSEGWGRAFLAYLIHVFKENNGKAMAPPDVVLEYTSEYREENDAITKFVRECTRPVVEGEVVVTVRKESLTDTFKQWWESNRGTRDWRIQEMLKTVETMYGKYQRGGWKTFQLQHDD